MVESKIDQYLSLIGRTKFRKGPIQAKTKFEKNFCLKVVGGILRVERKKGRENF